METAPLEQTSSGTPAGTFLRRYWHPVALASDLERGRAIGIKIMGEELTLYRGSSSSKVFLVGGICAHRCTRLYTGWVEEDSIRCFYHGWRYDGSGQCVEQPSAPATSKHASRIRIPSYPTQEYAGLIFAYFGPDSPPEFPRYPELDETSDKYAVFASSSPPRIWPVNYFQMVENNVDWAHFNFAHSVSKHFNRQAVQSAEPVETQHGLRIISERGPRGACQWHLYLPNVLQFPIPMDGYDVVHFTWAVPVDDTHTFYCAVDAIPLPPDRAEKALEMMQSEMKKFDAASLTLHGGRRGPPTTGREQDYTVIVGQGAIADRINEHLGYEDTAIVLLRKLYRRGLMTAGWKAENAAIPETAERGVLPAPPVQSRSA
jgi:nitrite reductase/ring-hydroxylating ferredoxin subunit